MLDNHSSGKPQPQQPPVSVLRKSGSYANLQQQKSQDPPSPRGNRKTKVTVINTESLPNYSTERYYMLSELQLKSHSTVFLRDLFPLRGEDDTDDLSTASSSGTLNNDEKKNYEENRDIDNEAAREPLPPCVMLYLLWKPNSQFQTPESYAKHVVKPAIDQILELHKSSSNFNAENSIPSIYVVVDRIALANESHHLDTLRKAQILISERLIRIVATDLDLRLRNIIQGITVGLSSDFRAAPGLETCMDSVLVGDAERRHFSYDKSKKEMSIIRNGKALDPTKSCVGIFTEYPDDLTGLDSSGETDAVQSLLLHARSTGNWSGKGNVLNFAARAQKVWRELWDFDCLEVRNERDLKHIGNTHSILSSRRRKKNDKKDGSSSMHYLPSQQLLQRTEQTADMMIACFLSFLAAFVWKHYHAEIKHFLEIVFELANGVLTSLKNK